MCARQEHARERTMKIGDLVRECVGGPIMRILGFLDACRVAVCQVLWSSEVKRVAVASLIAVGMLGSTLHGHPPEDPPNHPVNVKTVLSTTAGASGAIVAPFALEEQGPPVPLFQQRPWLPYTVPDDEVLP